MSQEKGISEIVEGIQDEIQLTGADLAAFVGVPENVVSVIFQTPITSSESASLIASDELDSHSEEMSLESDLGEALPARGYKYVQRISKRSRLFTKYGFKFVCCREVSSRLPCGKVVTVPVGFLSDGVTRGYSKVGEVDWLVHDWLYATRGLINQISQIPMVSRLKADAVFLKFPQFHRWLAVRIFARSYWGRQQIAMKRRIQPDLIKYT